MNRIVKKSSILLLGLATLVSGSAFAKSVHFAKVQEVQLQAMSPEVHSVAKQKLILRGLTLEGKKEVVTVSLDMTTSDFNRAREAAFKNCQRVAEKVMVLKEKKLGLRAWFSGDTNSAGVEDTFSCSLTEIQ